MQAMKQEAFVTMDKRSSILASRLFMMIGKY
jgi:hypothetical protein